jgi:hypothetical protein
VTPSQTIKRLAFTALSCCGIQETLTLTEEYEMDRDTDLKLARHLGWEEYGGDICDCCGQYGPSFKNRNTMHCPKCALLMRSSGPNFGLDLRYGVDVAKELRDVVRKEGISGGFFVMPEEATPHEAGVFQTLKKRTKGCIQSRVRAADRNWVVGHG